jgi:hypothetical protein
MKRSIARWTTVMAVAAAIAMPTTSFAQPPAPPSPSASPTPQSPPAAPAGQDAAKQHLTAARNALSEMTQLPAAPQLTGDARTHVSQLISTFNELITVQSDWRASYAKIEASLTALIGAQTTDESPTRTTGTAGAVGTAGTVVALDPSIRAKLVEFRDHLDRFAQASGGVTPAAAAASSPDAGTPAAAAPPAATEAANSPQTGAPASSEQPHKEEILRHIDAIEAILGVPPPGTASPTASPAGTGAASSGSVTLTTSQIEQLRTHLNELRRLIR